MIEMMETMVVAPTRREALAKLTAKMEVYRCKHKVKSWNWRHRPEAKQCRLCNKLWQAYGRIEFEKV